MANKTVHRDEITANLLSPPIVTSCQIIFSGQGFPIHKAPVERGFGLAESCWSIEVCGFLVLSHMVDVLNVRARSSIEQDNSVTETEVADGLVVGGEGIEVER